MTPLSTHRVPTTPSDLSLRFRVTSQVLLRSLESQDSFTSQVLSIPKTSADTVAQSPLITGPHSNNSKLLGLGLKHYFIHMLLLFIRILSHTEIFTGVWMHSFPTTQSTELNKQVFHLWYEHNAEESKAEVTFLSP